MKYSKLSPEIHEKILTCFVEDLLATQTSVILKLNRKTVNFHYNLFRERILEYLQKNQEWLYVTDCHAFQKIEESPPRLTGHRGKSAIGISPIFGIVKVGDELVFKPVCNACREILVRIIHSRSIGDFCPCIKTWEDYLAIIVNGYDFSRIYHNEQERAEFYGKVGKVESFWAFIKKRIARYNGIKSDKVYLYLKECEFRYNHSKKEILRVLRTG